MKQFPGIELFSVPETFLKQPPLKSKIAPDKWRHFWAGIPMGIFFQLFASWIWNPAQLTAILVAFAAVVVVSYGFELFSKITGLGVYDVIDAVASIIGGVAGIALALLGARLF